MLQYLAQQSTAHANHSATQLVERLIELNPLLEAFGNVRHCTAHLCLFSPIPARLRCPD